MDIPAVAVPAAQWLEMLNRAIQATVQARPEYGAKTVWVTLPAAARQTIPADGFRFLDLPGIRRTTRAALDAYSPGWAAAAGSATVRNFVFDEDRPTEFWVEPPSSGAAVTLKYAAAPAALTAAAQTVPLPDVFGPALREFVLSLAHETVYAGEPDRAVAHRQAWERLVGLGSAGAAAAGGGG